jgi:pyruvate/2-oxoglutarate/acetoin dehydrogenase E1 component
MRYGPASRGHHSNSVGAWFVATPVLKVCIPSASAGVRGLLKTAIRDPDPVLVFEHRGLYHVNGEVPDAEHSSSRLVPRRSGASAAT